MDDYKEVFFHIYCESCKHKDKSDYDEPCAECLDHPLNVDSHRPVNWKKAKEKKS